MKIGEWKSAGSVAPLYQELRQIGLETNIAELDAFGFTVVPPKKVGPPEFCIEVREALERTMLRSLRVGRTVDRPLEERKRHTALHAMGRPYF